MSDGHYNNMESRLTSVEVGLNNVKASQEETNRQLSAMFKKMDDRATPNWGFISIFITLLICASSALMVPVWKTIDRSKEDISELKKVQNAINESVIRNDERIHLLLLVPVEKSTD